VTVARQSLGTLMRLGGAVFCAAWGVAIVLFPFYKGLPIGLVPIALGAVLGAVVAVFRHRVTSLLMRPSSVPFAVAISAAAFMLRAAAALHFPLEPANDHAMFYQLAANVAAGQGYTKSTGPTAFFPPGLPLLLAAIFWVVGTSVWVAKALGLALSALVVPVSYWFARKVGPEEEARWTTLIVAAFPTLVVYGATIGYESLLSLLVLGWAVLTQSVARTASGGPLTAVALGIVNGLAALVKPVALLLPVLSAMSWIGRLRLKQVVLLSAVSAVVMLAVILPWTLRNKMTLGHPVLISTNGGFVLYSANHDGSRGIATPVRSLPGEHDEVSRDRIRGQAAVRWILDNPSAFLQLMVPKAAYGWGTTSSIMSFVSYDRMPPREEDVWKALLNVGWGAFFLWCAAAAWSTRVWARPALTPALLFTLYIFAVHLVYEALSRHHVTLLPVLAVTAAAWLSRDSRPASERVHV